MTSQIVMAIQEHLNPKGVAVMIEARHMCMVMRGVKQPTSKTVTTSYTGIFKNDISEQGNFFNALNAYK